MSDKEKLERLYLTVSHMMIFLGMEGHIDTRNVLVEDVMSALYAIDSGDFGLKAMTAIIRNIENAPDANQLSLGIEQES